VQLTFKLQLYAQIKNLTFSHDMQRLVTHGDSSKVGPQACIDDYHAHMPSFKAFKRNGKGEGCSF